MTTVAIGPELREFGSWNWIGHDLLTGLPTDWEVVKFADLNEVPPADITVFLKFKPSTAKLNELASCTQLVFIPVDVYGSLAEISGDRESLTLFDLILVHSQRLRRYFTTCSHTEYVDHSLRFVTDEPVMPISDGCLFWAGRRCNIEPVVNWCNQHHLDRELLILTEEADAPPHEYGFRRRNTARIRPWSAAAHKESLLIAAAALDIKGDSFRARHKPPAKCLDYLASGLPVITNRGGSVDLHLQALSFSPVYDDNWQSAFTDDVRKQTFDFAGQLRRSLSRGHVMGRITELLCGLLTHQN